MSDTIAQLISQAEAEILEINSLDDIEQLRLKYLGKKGVLTAQLQQLGKLSAAERPKAGQAVNQAKQLIAGQLNDKREAMQQAELDKKLMSEKIDVTLPGRGQELGSFHPLTQMRKRVVSLLGAVGFQVVEGPEIEDEYHNFDALNTPAHHPARSMHDTFYIDADRLLRTQTSTVQIRGMLANKPPLRMITPGRVYRRDSDHTHTPMFHQLEGLVVDKHCNFAELKSLLHDFLNRLFETDLNIRFRPSFFPFTEPSAEVDIEWKKADGSVTWLEVLGCGMVHPNVFKSVNIDPDEYRGFAFGIGLDRLAMLRYQIPDLRMLFDNDVKFLEQFPEY